MESNESNKTSIPSLETQEPKPEGAKPERQDRVVSFDAPPVPGEDGKARKRGRPAKGEGSPKRPPVERVAGEVEFRKPASEIKNHYAAFDRIAEEEKKLYERKRELAAEYEKAVGKKLKFEAPVHPLDTQKAREPMSAGKASALGRGLYMVPAAAFGIEVRPSDDQFAMLGAEIANLSKYYDLDSEFMAWAGLSMCLLAVSAPALAELRSKKAGTWEVDREKFRAAGLLPPALVVPS